MKKALIGAGGFAREVMSHMQQSLPCFVENSKWVKGSKNTFPISDLDVSEYEILIAIGDSKVRQRIAESLPKETKFFTFIHPTAQILDDNVVLDVGSIVCANCVITTNVKIGKHSHLNLSSTIGHDCSIDDYFTTAPGVHISGNCSIGKHVYFGTNSSIKQGINICNNVTVGLNAGVTKHIDLPGTYIGTPAKLLKSYAL